MPSRPSWSRGFRAFTGLPSNINFQSGLKLHSEVVLPDNDPLKPALYQGFVEGFQVCGLLLYEIAHLPLYILFYCSGHCIYIEWL